MSFMFKRKSMVQAQNLGDRDMLQTSKFGSFCYVWYFRDCSRSFANHAHTKHVFLTLQQKLQKMRSKCNMEEDVFMVY